ncbi:MAG: hypothetical protein ABEJ35_05460 [Halobacteriaceae archaeon]
MSRDDMSGGTYSRRTALKLMGGTALLGTGAIGTASARGANIAIAEQTARGDPTGTDDFPVPDAYIVRLPRVKFEADTGTIALPVKPDEDGKVSPDATFWYEATDNAPAFVVGLHSPQVGNGRPDSLSSLIGVRPFRPGKYNNVNVPIWAGPPRWQRNLGAHPEQFPNGETIRVTATLWYGPDVFPPIAPRDSSKAIAQTPEDERNGPVRDARGLVSNSAPVTFPPR